MNPSNQRSQARLGYLQQALAHAFNKHAPGHKEESPLNADRSQWRRIRLPKGQPILLIEEKVDNLYRSSSFRNFIGDAILRFTHDADVDIGTHRLVLAVYYDRFPPGALMDLAAYSEAYLDGKLNWVLISGEGRGYMRLLGDEHEISLPNSLTLPSLSTSGPSAFSLFSSQNQWLLKCLLMPGLSPDRYWQGPSKRPCSISELADMANVPQSSVSTFVQCAENLGYLRRLNRGFMIVRHRELLDDWAAAIKSRVRGKSLGVRPLYGDEPVEKLLDRLGREHASHPKRISTVVSSHLACEILGISNSNQRGVILYARDDLESAMSSLQLTPDDSNNPWAVMAHPVYSKSIFNGAVYRPAYRAPLADLLQIYLDVKLSMARGAEQAEFIYESILAKHFRTEAPC